MTTVKMHDGSVIPVEIKGDGPAILLPVNPYPVEGARAEELRKWGADPALGHNLMKGLSDKYKVVAFDYEGHIQKFPKADTLTPNNVAKDFIAIADAVGVNKFVYYGYSWLALSGLQLAIRTDRLLALIMGGFPPIDGPYKEMFQVTKATFELSSTKDNSTNSPQETDELDWSTVEVTLNTNQTKQFVTLYKNLQDFSDRQVQSNITCPRLCFAGSADKISYEERWGGVVVDIAGPLLQNRKELESYGWDVEVLEGLDHTQAMQAKHVLPTIKTWLDAHM
nr:alpha/beta hydrolase [Shimazuella kribbensis]